MGILELRSIQQLLVAHEAIVLQPVTQGQVIQSQSFNRTGLFYERHHHHEGPLHRKFDLTSQSKYFHLFT